MNKPCLAITGANGFIGSNLSRHFLENGHRVIRFSRHASNPDERFFSLEIPTSPSLLQSVDILIHCAHQFSEGGPEQTDINYTGSKSLFDAANQAGIKKIIFISSRAAFAGTSSAYGISKLNTGNELFPVRDVILKCGLVIGPGGLFKKLYDFVKKKRIIPLVNGGNQPLQVIRIEELQQAVANCIESDLAGTFNLATNDAMSYKNFFKLLGSQLNKKINFVYMPAWLVGKVISVAHFLNIPFPINHANLAGLTSMKYISTSDDLKKVNISLLPPDQSIKIFMTGKKD